MNPTITNVTLLLLSIGAISKAIEFLTSSNFISGAVLFVAGLVLLFVYEKFPPSVPPQA